MRGEEKWERKSLKKGVENMTSQEDDVVRKLCILAFSNYSVKFAVKIVTFFVQIWKKI